MPACTHASQSPQFLWTQTKRAWFLPGLSCMRKLWDTVKRSHVVMIMRCFIGKKLILPNKLFSRHSQKLPASLQEISTFFFTLEMWSHTLPERAFPFWSNRRAVENQVHTKCQPEVWTALSTETRVSSCLKTHSLGWYWIYSSNFKAWHRWRLETIISVCMAQLWVKQHPVSDFY